MKLSGITAIIWDCDETIPEGDLVFLWTGYQDYERSISLLKLLEEHSEELRKRFFEITEKNDKVFFDLFLFKIIPKETKGTGNNPLSIDVPLPEESYSKLIDKIKSAFDEQFTLYQEMLGVDVFEGNIDILYKINHVQTHHDFIIPIQLDYYIDTDTNDIINSYSLEIINKWDKERKRS